MLTIPPGHLWRDKWTTLIIPGLAQPGFHRGMYAAGFLQAACCLVVAAVHRHPKPYTLNPKP